MDCSRGKKKDVYGKDSTFFFPCHRGKERGGGGVFKPKGERATARNPAYILHRRRKGGEE